MLICDNADCLFEQVFKLSKWSIISNKKHSKSTQIWDNQISKKNETDKYETFYVTPLKMS